MRKIFERETIEHNEYIDLDHEIFNRTWEKIVYFCWGLFKLRWYYKINNSINNYKSTNMGFKK
jgi:hypothetical protein